jgi:hypothetical protein
VGTPVGLEAPARPSLVPPVGGGPPPDPGGLAATATYLTDRAVVAVHDPSAAGLARLSELLGLLGESGSAALVNAGAYAAQRTSAARPGQDLRTPVRSTGRSFAWADAGLELWSIENVRDPGAPQGLATWIASDDPVHGPLLTMVDAELALGVDASFPFGRLGLSYAGAVDAAAIATPFFAGAVSADGGAGAVATLRVYEATGDLGQVPGPGQRFEELQVAAALDAGRVSGRARVFRRWREDAGAGDTGVRAEEWLLAFDADTLLRGRNGAAPLAFARAAPREVVWRYGLYESSGPTRGERVDPSAGFGVRTAAGEYGWLGPHGLRFEDSAAVSPGDVVTRDVYGEAAGPAYTVVTAPGRLLRLTRHALDLTEVAGRRLQWLAFDEVLRVATLHEVAYDAVLGWRELSTWDPPTRTFVDHPLPVALDVVALGALALWSEELGGRVGHVAGSGVVSWYEVEPVDGSDPVFAGNPDLPLFGFVDCLRAGSTADEAEAGDVHLADAPDAVTPHRFVFDRTDLTLRYDPDGTGTMLAPVGLAAGEVPATGPYAWGLSSGPLLTTPAVPGGTVGAVWDVDEIYVWETGPHPWNRFAGLVDGSGDHVEVGLPERFLYRHATARDRNSDSAQDGLLFVLELVPGLGLRGFPWRGVDLDLDGADDRWIPTVALADGTLLGPQGAEVLVRALDLEELPNPDPGYAGSLSLVPASDLVVPDAASYVAPDEGPAPTIAEAPRVIEGVVVGSP